MDLGLKDKRAFVGGGSRGIGKAIALELAREGVDVVIASRTKSALDEAAKEIEDITGRRVIPGWIQLTVIPNLPTWVARVLVMWTSDTLRAPPLRLPAFRALPPLMLMIRPQGCSFR